MEKTGLNENHKRNISALFQNIEEKILEIEFLLNRQIEKSSDIKYKYDLNHNEIEILKNKLPILREIIIRATEILGIKEEIRILSLRWSILTLLDCILVDLEEIEPKRLKNYGELDSKGEELINSIIKEISEFIIEILKELKDVKK